MKKSFIITTITACMILCMFGCTPKQDDQLTDQQKEIIRQEIKTIGDSIMAKAERMDARWLDVYINTPDWGMVNADGTRWDYEHTIKVQPEFASIMKSWKWTSTHREFKFLTKDIVICAWDGKDETIMKSGDKVIMDPHAYTLIFKKIDGEWRVIYSHDSGIPVMQQAENVTK